MLEYYVECLLPDHSQGKGPKEQWVVIDWRHTAREANAVAAKWSKKGETRVGRSR